MSERISLKEIFMEIHKKAQENQITECMYSIFEEVSLFLELADPDFAYPYQEVSDNEWEFKDRYGNKVGVRYIKENRFFESYYLVKSKNGVLIKLFNYNVDDPGIDPTSFQGGSDQHRSDTICKILRDEVVPRTILKKPFSSIRLHPLNDYRYKIFKKCAEICVKYYPELEVRELGAEIHLISRGLVADMK